MNYTLILNVIIILLYIYFRKSNRSNKNYVTFITILLIFISSLRHVYVGSDTVPYLIHFEEAQKNTWGDFFSAFIEAYLNPSQDGGKDPAMWLLNKLIGSFSDSQFFFLFITSSLYLIPLGYFVYKFSTDITQICFSYVLFVTLYYPFMPNSAIRQSIATAIILLGILALADMKKQYLYFIFVFVASLFHKSALLLIFLPFLLKLNVSKFYKYTIVLFGMTLILYPILGAFMAEASDVYSKYGTNTFYATKSRPYMILLFYFVMYMICLLKINILHSKINDEIHIKLMAILSSLSLIFIPFVLLDSTLIRLSGYYVLGMCLFVPYCMKFYSPFMQKTIFFILMAVLLYRSYNAPELYAFFWQHMDIPDWY